MLLTRQTDYSVRVLLYAGLHEDRAITIGDVAREFRASQNHLKKVVLRLAKLGYVRTTRGRGGGLRLARSPKDINLRDIVQDREPTFEIIDCHKPPCPIAGSCMLKKALLDARDCFLEALGRYTLADLLSNRSQLHKLLKEFSV